MQCQSSSPVSVNPVILISFSLSSPCRSFTLNCLASAEVIAKNTGINYLTYLATEVEENLNGIQRKSIITDSNKS